MDPARVLVVEDDVRLARIVGNYLEHDGFIVQLVHDGAEAIETSSSFRPDVVLLDVMLPRVDGMGVCRHLRAASDCYILMLTAREAEADKLLALSLGADDYVVKPCSPREILARVRAMLRRPRLSISGAESQAIALGPVKIDIAGRRAHVAGSPVELTRTEFELLLALALRPTTVQTRRELIEGVWGPDWFGDEHIVDVHIANLRRKLAGGVCAWRSEWVHRRLRRGGPGGLGHGGRSVVGGVK